MNTATFGNSANIYGAFINNGLLSDNGTIIWATNFLNSCTISSGSGAFTLNAQTATLTNFANGSIIAGSGVSITSGSLVVSNHMIRAGRNLTLQVTNLLTDTGVTNGNVWVVGSASGGGINSGFNVLVKPPVGDLLGTTVTNIAPASKTIYNVWAGTNYGISNQGFTNNLALGRLILDSLGPVGNTKFQFNGVGTNNAMYVDYLEFRDYATNGNSTNWLNFPWLKINTNMVIYYAQAVMNGVSIAENLDFASRVQGANGGRLRWVPTYNGYFSSTNLVYPAGVTNTVNAALRGSIIIDSDGDGVVNANDPTPFFLSSQVNFTLTLATNRSPLSVRVQWTTVANATNFIYYRTNLAAGSWLPFTNFNNYYYANNLSVTNAAHSNTFASPQVYQPYPNGAPATNVWVFDAVTNTPHYYRVLVQPWVTYPY